MPTLNLCPECGAELTRATPAGMCSRCLFHLGLAAGPSKGGSADGTGFGFNSISKPLEQAPSIFQPRRFGDYELLEEVARGGMGVVYRARQASLDRIVAVKVVLGGPFAAREQVVRFQAEAAAAARLQHPNIVAIHETGEHEGQPFYSMDFVPGGDLSGLVRQRPLTAPAAAKLVQALAQAVHYAHEQGILHRDLKPANILLDDSGQPRIADFGLARHVATDASLTLAGQVLGSPDFMPPEQAGAPLATGRWSDVYGLGGILYYVLTGRPPFLAETSSETLRQVLDREPVSPRLLRPGLPTDLATVCLKCLEKDPGKRYATAKELAEELGRFLNGEPVRAHPVGWAGKAHRWSRRRPALTVLLVLLLMAVSMGLSGILWQWRRAEIERRAARASERTALLRTYASEVLQAHRELEDGNQGAAEALLEMHRPRPGTQDPRGWEWRHLWSRTRSDELRLAHSHQGAAYNVSMSPDGRHLAVAVERRNGGVWVHDLLSDLRTVVALGESVGSVQFSPDGSRLAYGTTSGQVVVLNWPARQEIARLPVPQKVREGFGMAFSPDGSRLATGDRSGRIAVWAFDPVRALWNQPGHESSVTSLAFTPDGERLASGTTLNDIQVWEVESGRLRSRLTGHTSAVQSVAISPDGKTLVSGAWDHTVRVWDLDSGALLTNLTTHTAWVAAVAFSPDGTLLASGSADHSIKLWNTATWHERRTLNGNRDEVFGLTLSPDGRRLYSASKDGTIREWSTVEDPPKVDSIDWLPHADKSRFALATPLLAIWHSHGFTVWHVLEMRPLTEYAIQAGKDGQITGLAVSPMGDHAAMANRHGDLRLLPLSSSGTEVNLHRDTSGYRRPGFSPSGRLLGAITGDGHLEIWQVAAPRRRHRLRPGGGLPLRHRFAPDERSIVVSVGEGWGDGQVEVWDLQTGERAGDWRAGRGEIIDFAFLSGGRVLVTAGGDARLQAWSYPDGAQLALKRTMNSFNSAAVSPDGRRLAAGTYNGRIHVWDTDTFLEVAAFSTGDGDIKAVGFSPDGHTLISVGTRRLRLWRAPPWEEVDAPSNLRSIHRNPGREPSL